MNQLGKSSVHLWKNNSPPCELPLGSLLFVATEKKTLQNHSKSELFFNYPHARDHSLS